MLEELKQKTYEADMKLPYRGLITHTQRNVSGIDREEGLFVIKSSGVDHGVLKSPDVVIMDLKGNKAENEVNPSSDTTTRVEPYSAPKEIGGIVHTHSPYATTWAQTGRAFPCYGTTHANYLYGETLCARNLTAEEIEGGYEMSTGRVIIGTFWGKNPVYIPIALCKDHGPLIWEKDAAGVVHSAAVLKEIARVNFMTELTNSQARPAPQCMQDKHFMRKHEPSTYCGQGK